MNRILIVDDNRMICECFKLVLTLEGYCVTLATGGAEGLLRFEEQQFDLVISDVCMPDYDGNSLARHIKSSAKATPVVAITGSVELACEAFDNVVAKPISASDLAEIVNDFFNIKKHRKQREYPLAWPG